VRYTYATLGGGVGGGVDEGNVYVRLVPKGDREASAEDLAAVVRDQTSRFAGATYSVFTNTFGGGRKTMQFQLRGPDQASVARAADQVAAVVRATPGAVDVGPVDEGAEARAQRRAGPRRGRRARASPPGRSPRPSARRSPGSTRATGRTRAARCATSRCASPPRPAPAPATSGSSR
jgi:multidrug efflux pump subunit AcrB